MPKAASPAAAFSGPAESGAVRLNPAGRFFQNLQNLSVSEALFNLCYPNPGQVARRGFGREKREGLKRPVFNGKPNAKALVRNIRNSYR
jgi:hypothetical protein